MANPHKYGNPAKRAAALKQAPHNPHLVLVETTRAVARQNLEALKMLRDLAQRNPGIEGMNETLLNFEVASLALIESLDYQHGKVPAREET